MSGAAYMKKNDIILIVVLIILSIASVFILRFSREEGRSLLVLIDKEEYKTFDLSEDTTFRIDHEDGGFNVFQIKDGYVEMISASCPDKIDILTKKIHYDKETIKCLPNRVFLQISGGEISEVDSVVN